LYDHIVACNTHDLGSFRPFIVAGKQVGWIRHELARNLGQWPEISNLAGGKVTLRGSIGDVEDRTAAVAKVCEALVAQKLLPPSRAEQFPVMAAFGDALLMRLDRVWVPAFGVTAYGVHVNGYVETPTGPEVWIGVRSADSLVDPGKLDNMVAGGQPVGLTLEENVIKEAAEEASVPEALARQARPVGALSYAMELPVGLRRAVLFVYDLHVSEDFHPVDQDGEHSSFEKMPVAEALRLVDETDRFKFNVNLVIIDFAIRHGVLTPDHRDYLKLIRGLKLGAQACCGYLP
jgi:8-oxo-dGTP pyrophosphatase MutT (NUDIX family)